MLIYRDDERPVETAAEWRALAARVDGLPRVPSHDEVTALLIEIGEIESAVLDALFPAKDDRHPLADALGRVTHAAGQLLVASWRDREAVAPAVERLRRAAGNVDAAALPRTVGRRVSEGYAYYALHPESYAEAAERFAARIHPAACCCIGIRSIGTSLAAVVAAAAGRCGVAATILSVRPRGHPFARTLRLGERLRAALARQPAITFFLVVDEGPGLSGSSFTSVARTLRESGIEAGRIVFFPSWDADGSTFRSSEAHQIWSQHARWTVAAPEPGPGLPAGAGGAEDWSGGAWRRSLLPAGEDWPAVQPQHERIKFMERARGTVTRFAGLGRYGEARWRRARQLADEGFGVSPVTLSGGYLSLPFVPGLPFGRRDFGTDLLEHVARYAACLTRAFPARRESALDVLHLMIETNLREADGTLRIPSLAAFDPSLHDSATTALDGRMLAHEFVRTASGVLKTDALDHADDHFFPGPQDIAWDLAAFEAEFDLDRQAADHLLRCFASQAGDPSIGRRMPFYRLAYAAFQLGYASMAVESLAGTPDAQRFARRRAEFLARGRALLARAA